MHAAYYFQLSIVAILVSYWHVAISVLKWILQVVCSILLQAHCRFSRGGSRLPVVALAKLHHAYLGMSNVQIQEYFLVGSDMFPSWLNRIKLGTYLGRSSYPNEVKCATWLKSAIKRLEKTFCRIKQILCCLATNRICTQFPMKTFSRQQKYFRYDHVITFVMETRFVVETRFVMETQCPAQTF